MKQIGKLLPNNSNLQSIPITINRQVVNLAKMIGTLILDKELEQYLGKNEKISNILIGYEKDKDGVTYEYGVLIKITEKLIMPDKTIRAIFNATDRVKIIDINKDHKIWQATYEVCNIDDNNKKLEPIIDEIKYEYNEIITGLSNKELVKQINASKSKEEVFSRALFYLNNLEYHGRLEILCKDNDQKRLESLLTALVDFKIQTGIKREIEQRVKKRVAIKNREFYLQEQIKEINTELSGGSDINLGDVETRLAKINLSDEAKDKVKKILLHIKRLQPMAPEASALRTYLEVISELPWNVYKKDDKSLKEAENILNNSHYGLNEAKEHILDFIAVKKIAPMAKGSILCLVGPPGVGKTSLAKSIASALGRDFIKLSLGGLKDEAEIRGHSRTYLHSLPGKIIQNIQKSPSSNPVFLLDEIDKISSSSYRGDPSSALLEVLDPEQNSLFTDTYLELPFDLSQVMFITTANTINDIPLPLLDRMEIIKLSGYTELEKMSIIQNFLINKLLKDNGLADSKLTITKDAMQTLIKNYTLESGVRSLEREINRLIRKIISQYLMEDKFDVNKPAYIEETIDKECLLNRLGKIKYNDRTTIPLEAGIALGLAWTSYGGIVMPIEAFFTTGSGKINLTGKLGDVMKESAQIAFSFVKIYLESKNNDLFKNFDTKDLHLHAIEGAVPKDGPSAGITMASAIYSSITNKKLKENLAMTGELTLSGQILAIGGLKEKALAAHRYGVKHLVLSSRNEKDIDEIPNEIKDEMEFHFFNSAYDAFEFIFN